MSSPFDEIGKTPEWSDEDKAKFEKLDYLIHRTFKQTESGAELLDIWLEHLVLTPGSERGDDLLTIGMREGTKQFIRNIILTIRKVENE